MLQIVTVSLAPTSAALVSGRVATNGVKPWESVACGLDLRTVAAANAAMHGGVSSTAHRVSSTNVDESLAARKSRASSNGSRRHTSTGSERPCHRHSNHR